MKLKLLIITVVLACVASAPRTILAQTITVTPTTVAVGQTVSVTVSGAPGNVGSWIGMYAANILGPGLYQDWLYLSGTQVLPASGLTTATVNFTIKTAGTYQFVLNSDEWYSPISLPSAVVTATAVTSPISLTAGAITCTLTPGTQIQVKCVGPNGSTVAASFPSPVPSPGTTVSFPVGVDLVVCSFVPSRAQTGKTDWTASANGIVQGGTF